MTIPSNKDICKNFYSTDELASMPWFPAKSPSTIRTLIRKGAIKAVNVSTTGKLPRFKIAKEEIIRYLVCCGFNPSKE